jgi:thiol-disulfide isomerase/thioredoxin
MKLFASLLVLSVSALTSQAPGQTTNSAAITGIWQGTATARGGAQVPATVKISGSGGALKLALLNGPADHPDESPATTVTFDGTHLVASYDYFARKFDATLTGDTLSGTYVSDDQSTKNAVSIPFTLKRIAKAADPLAQANPPNILGAWEIAAQSSKGDTAWEFRVDPATGKSPVIKTVIQRIDGDTGGLWGTWNGTSYIVGHFNAAGVALFSVTPLPDNTLKVSNLIPAAHPTGAATEWIARRPAEARKENLPAPTETTQQTTVKDPSVPFAFSFPDLAGKTVSNTDAQFQGKVVIVAIGGSWCPNCHDEAPLLVDLYKKYHSKGLEVVSLDFEQENSASDTDRLKAFIKHYGIPYTVLVSGTTDELNEKIPQGVNLNCWPTSFFLGRDGRVVETHAGFAGPGNTAGHEALVKETTALVEKLLAQPAPKQTAQAK